MATAVSHQERSLEDKLHIQLCECKIREVSLTSEDERLAKLKNLHPNIDVRIKASYLCIRWENTKLAEVNIEEYLQQLLSRKN